MQNEEKKLDDFIQKIVKETGLETPSKDFTQNVISRIEEERSPSTSYRPLISKPFWGILVLAVAGLITYIFLAKVDTSIRWLEQLGLNRIPKDNILESLSTISLPNTVLYSIAALALFIYVQIFLLKNHWAKKRVLY